MNPIRENLFDLADEVSNVDLYQRALRTSHRLAWTRFTVAGAVLVLVAALAAAGLTLHGRTNALPPVAPTSSPPNPLLVPPATGGDLTMFGGWLDFPATTLPGRAFFLQYDSNRIGNLVDLGSGHVRLGGLTNLTWSRCAANSLTVSPDGRLAAYARGDSDSVGFVVELADLATMERTDIPAAVWCGGQAPIVFTADSKSIIFRQATANGTRGPAVRYRLSDGQVTAVTDREASSVYAGGHSAAIEDGDIVVRDANGLGLSRCATSQPTVVVEVSADGRYVSTAPPAPNDVNQHAAQTVVDTLSCQIRPIPAGGEEVVGVRLTGDGGLLVVMRPQGEALHVRLLNPDGSTAADVPWPSVANIPAQAIAPLLYLTS
jgi:hypothetical protein